MIRALYIIGVLLILSGCHSEGSELEKLWIGKYTIHDSGTEKASIHEGVESILNFKRDSVEVKLLKSDYRNNSNGPTTNKYSIRGGKLFLNDNGKIDTVPYALSKDSLILDYPVGIESKLIFERLPEYNLASMKDEFSQKLKSFTFATSDSTRIQFIDGGLAVTLQNYPNDFDLPIWRADRNKLGTYNERWSIDTYAGELFLLFNYRERVAVMHVSEILPKSFEGVFYGFEKHEMVCTAIEEDPLFKVENLYGEWVEQAIAGLPFLDLSILNDKRSYFKREHLHFGDSTLSIKHEYKSSTSSWSLNRERDLIIFPDEAILSKKHSWKIEKLTSDELVIRRVREGFYDSNQTIEVMSFIRK